MLLWQKTGEKATVLKERNICNNGTKVLQYKLSLLTD